MAQIRPYLANLNGGLLSPLLAGRVDLAKYQNCLATADNVVALVQGGVMRRWGTRYRGTVENAPPYTLTLSALTVGAGRTASTSAAYWIASDVGRVITAGTGVATITAVNTTVEAVITISAEFAASPIAAGDWTITPRLARLIPFVFSADDAAVIECGADVLRFWKYTAGVPALCASGATIVRVGGTGLTEAYLPSVQHAQSADVVLLAHPSLAPKEVKRLAADGTDWLGGAYSPTIPATYEAGEYPAKAATLSAATVGLARTLTIDDATAIFLNGDIGRYVSYRGGRAIITAVGGAPVGSVATIDITAAFPAVALPSGAWQIEGSPVTGLNTAGWEGYLPPVGQSIALTAYDLTSAGTLNAFRATDAGKFIAAKDGIFRIQSYVDPTTVNTICIQVQSSVAGASNQIANFGQWQLLSPAWDGTRGYPRAVAFHEQRAMFGGTTAQRNALWVSPTADYQSLGVGTRDDDGFTAAPLTGQVPSIQWMATGRRLTLGTVGDVIAASGTQDGAITPTSVDLKPSESGVGCAGVQPVRLGGSTLFVRRGGRALMEYTFDFTVDRYVVRDLTIEADPVRVSGTMAELAACDYPGPTNASAIGISSQPVVFARLNDAAGTLLCTTYDPTNKVNGWATHTLGGSGIVESVAAVPHPTAGHDEVWLVVRRTVNGRTVRYLEVVTHGATMDSSIAGTMASGTTISGLGHLEGQTVGIRARRTADSVWRIYRDKTVTGGAVTVAESVDAYEVGLKFPWTITTVRLQPSGAPNLQGEVKRFVTCAVRHHETPTLLINSVRTPPGYSATADYTIPTPSTDDFEVATMGWTAAGQVTIGDTLPVAATVLSIYGDVEVGR